MVPNVGIPDASTGWNSWNVWNLLERVKLIFFSKRQFPAVTVGIEDVDRVIVGAAVGADLFYHGAGFLQHLERFCLFLPRDVEGVVRIGGARSFGGVEDMHFEIAESDVDFSDLAGFELLFRRFNGFDDFAKRSSPDLAARNT